MALATGKFAFLFRPYAELWRYAPLVGAAGLESFGLFWDLQGPRDEALAALATATDRTMRSPAFLGLMQFGLTMMNRSTAIVCPGALRRFSNSLLRTRGFQWLTRRHTLSLLPKRPKRWFRSSASWGRRRS
ncbi:MAG TPA: hypothetical protein VK762_00775 [Polyangiaceae bacterium]|nr:hypothetical protein [Polyangiaceae bacterium]